MGAYPGVGACPGHYGISIALWYPPPTLHGDKCVYSPRGDHLRCFIQSPTTMLGPHPLLLRFSNSMLHQTAFNADVIRKFVHQLQYYNGDSCFDIIRTILHIAFWIHMVFVMELVNNIIFVTASQLWS